MNADLNESDQASFPLFIPMRQFFSPWIRLNCGYFLKEKNSHIHYFSLILQALPESDYTGTDSL